MALRRREVSLLPPHQKTKDKDYYIMHMPHVSNKGFIISMKNLMKKTTTKNKTMSTGKSSK